jgi:hypothetical protein
MPTPRITIVRANGKVEQLRLRRGLAETVANALADYLPASSAVAIELDGVTYDLKSLPFGPPLWVSRDGREPTTRPEQEYPT